EIRHHRFDDLPDLLAPHDLLVVNDSAVIPARLIGRKEPTGGQAEILLLEQLGRRRWRAMVKPGARLRPGAVVTFTQPPRTASSFVAQVADVFPDGTRAVVFEGRGRFREWLEHVGRPPLPPYIPREVEERDSKDYQTVYARKPGAVAAPTAGLHFDRVLLDMLKRRRIGLAALTLHVGAGTFRPVRSENLDDHTLESERYTVGGGTLRRIWSRRSSSRGRVVAVGTTVTRTLETVATSGILDPAGTAGEPTGSARERRFERLTGDADLFIRPGYNFRAIDGLITNFHLPRSSLLALVAAFAGLAPTLNAYRIAVNDGYRFYSYGDAMLIL
ncbi:MAG TPA: tRNA preQ1(34) S-adenosylmethionine ribosyltransferase-isomerase QueA, partial [Acidobacteriota bacterium]|nr:tRNA preQ1(34) S-adenosylmethionine ribosyltransferase-isomerase QueA [Acidobacteriota bacterium]